MVSADGQNHDYLRAEGMSLTDSSAALHSSLQSLQLPLLRGGCDRYYCLLICILAQSSLATSGVVVKMHMKAISVHICSEMSDFVLFLSMHMCKCTVCI